MRRPCPSPGIGNEKVVNTKEAKKKDQGTARCHGNTEFSRVQQIYLDGEEDCRSKTNSQGVNTLLSWKQAGVGIRQETAD